MPDDKITQDEIMRAVTALQTSTETRFKRMQQTVRQLDDHIQRLQDDLKDGFNRLEGELQAIRRVVDNELASDDGLVALEEQIRAILTAIGKRPDKQRG